MIAYLRRMKELVGVGLLLLAFAGGCAERDAAASEAFQQKTDADVRQYIQEEPDRYCRSPLFHVADDTTLSMERTIKVVNVPTNVEKKLLPKEELANTDLWRPVPPLALGDEVVVTGTWTQRSPSTGESHSMGLLVYGSLVNVTRSWP